MQKRYLPISVFVVVMAIVALVGYLQPAGTEEMPRRILFDNAGGKVIFSHQAHDQTYQLDCASCHHENPAGGEPGKEPLRCGLCHPPEFTPNWIETHASFFNAEQNCARCHHAEFTGMVYKHDEHAEQYNTDCLDCHHTDDIEPTPTNCGDCHLKEGDATMPGFADAVHTRCATCHQDVFAQEMKGCGFCHELLQAGGDNLPETGGCSSCHDKAIEQLIPTRMSAFHKGCMGCHEEKQLGPFKDDECSKCHLPR